MMMIMFLFVLMASADSNCKIGEDFKCPAVSNKEITVEYGTSALIGIIYNGEITDYKVTLTLYESTDNGLVPYHCCVFPWGNTSCSGCPRLHFEKKGNDTNIILGDVGRGTTFNLTTEGINSFHNFHGAVLVESVPSDNENPVISGCPNDQSVNTDNGNATALVTWTPPTASDNSGFQMLTSTNDPGDYFPVGNTPVTYTSIDGSLNTETCTFHVHVIDNENPVISRCPRDQNVNTDSGNDTAVVTWTPPTATDNSGSQMLMSTYNPGDYFPVGNTTVTYTSIDGSWNIQTCTFNIHVPGLSTSGKGSLIPLLVLLVPCNLVGVCYVIWILIRFIENKRDKHYHSVPAKSSLPSPTQLLEPGRDQVTIDV